MTFSIKPETIIIFENQNYFNYRNNREIIKDYGIIYFNNHNHIEKIVNKRGDSSFIRIISINSLKEEINFLRPKTFEFFLNKGLNKRSNPKSTISLLLRNRIKKTKNLISYTFNCSNNTSDNDIPFFHKDAPDGFSYFCTQDEYIQILSHIKTEEYKIQLIQKKQKVEEEIIHTEPEPNKKQFLCQICKSRFDNY